MAAVGALGAFALVTAVDAARDPAPPLAVQRPAPDASEWQLVSAYLIDPARHGELVLALAADAAARGRILPTALELAAADAQLRAGRSGPAELAFARARDGAPTGLAQLADLGTGVALLERSAGSAAIEVLAAAAEAGGDLGQAATLLRALGEASLGRSDDATRTLASLDTDRASELATAEALVATSIAVTGPRLRRSAALAHLRRMDSACALADQGSSLAAARLPQLRRLRPRVLLRRWLEAYRRATPLDLVVRPHAWMTAVACETAVAVLAPTAREQVPARLEDGRSAALHVATQTAPSERSRAPRSPKAPAGVAADPQRSGTSGFALGLATAALVLCLLGVRWRGRLRRR